MQKETKYFSDLYIFINFVLENKLIFLISFFIFLSFVGTTFLVNINKYNNSINNYVNIEIDHYIPDELNNKNLEKIYPVEPLIRFSYNKFSIENIFREFKNSIQEYLNNNNITHKVNFDDKNNFKLEILIKSDADLNLIDSDNIEKIYLKNFNNFKQFYLEEIDFQYYRMTYAVFDQLINFGYTFRNYSKLEAEQTFNRLGVKYTLDYLCELNNSNEIYLADKTTYYCQNQINKFNDKVCKIVPLNVDVKNFTTSLIFSKEECLGGVYIDKDKTFESLIEYINIVTKTKLINYTINKFKKNIYPQPKLGVYVLSWIVFSFFFGLILSFLFKAMKNK